MGSCRIAQRLPRLWYRRQLAVALLPLLPFSWLFRLIVWARFALYRFGALRSYRLPVPVIVIGNLTVGGSGKTPLVIWLVERLSELGWRPGIISRGYGGAIEGVQPVAADSDASVVGDEPLLLARRVNVPVFVGRDRVAAGQALLDNHPECNVIVSDDGLQHYRLQRAVEIAVFDGRGAGNARLLPAGPLREPLQRLAAVSAVVRSATPLAQKEDATRGVPHFEMRLVGQRFYLLTDAQHSCSADDLQGKRLYAMAGIGDPSRFFRQLEALGLEFEARPFPDHHIYRAADLAFAHDGVVLMTEKDAVKCAALVAGVAWVLPVEAQVISASADHSLLDIILEKIDGRALA
ncbi:MAG TPA: tetraacyldisaccharide 4'-kinase [Candidatus Propionivibrio aalborgensis]|nr:tetraacyldisaccharide 4'-kinase [Candidatus Propionivibrio aalborgensis]